MLHENENRAVLSTQNKALHTPCGRAYLTTTGFGMVCNSYMLHARCARDIDIGALTLPVPSFSRPAGLRSKQVLLTDRFEEGLMLLRNIFRWHLIDLSYITLNQTKTRMSAAKKRANKKRGVEDHRPTFDELSIEVPHVPCSIV